MQAGPPSPVPIRKCKQASPLSRLPAGETPPAVYDGTRPAERTPTVSHGRHRPSRPQLQILADLAGHLPAVADRPVPSDLLAGGELHARHHAGDRHVLCRISEFRSTLS